MTSRNPTGRPRRVAGRAQRPGDEPAVVEEVALQPSRDPVTDVPAEPATPADLDLPSEYYDVPGPEDEVEEEPYERSSLATLLLVVAIVLLVAVAIVEGLYFKGPLRDDPTVSSDRPVLLDEITTKSAVDTAAQAAQKFSARSYQTYDEDVDAAADTMTTAYAEEFRQTTDEIKADFVAAETEVTVELEAQAVMSASDNQVQALVFLTQYTTKKDVETTFTPFRIKVTLIKAGDTWLVSAVDTA